MGDLAEIAPTLGRRMHSQAFALRGRLDEDGWKSFLINCAEAMDMSPISDPAVWRYPIDGKGGCGTTIVQPITESFLALDTWSDHGGAYLFIASCKNFKLADMFDTIDSAGFEIADMTSHAILGL